MEGPFWAQGKARAEVGRLKLDLYTLRFYPHVNFKLDSEMLRVLEK